VGLYERFHRTTHAAPSPPCAGSLSDYGELRTAMAIRETNNLFPLFSYWLKRQRLPSVAASIGTVYMSFIRNTTFIGTMLLSLWARCESRQVYGISARLPASFWINRPPKPRRQFFDKMGISTVEIVGTR